ncbi:tRNA(Ile)-lysidine synthetase [Fructilactobacillus florum 8D]|uniref:tRNA(Ile)-lysidine synthase n=1 Tax=Fructilactobacillus florum 8D TaxID=1221538 RepID=W9EGN7_9LACO|nr:tRNA lysidine(34) synthetase TilS [Fructilactobacillus florum]ETO40391.1 tRNA(Ile)-lysidine synthetase [Fructilactobacillus florum 8D]
MDLQQKIDKLVAQHQWWRPGENVVVAVSGGIDSMVLLDLLQRLGTDRPALIIAHVNHCLRANSTHEAAALQRYCEVRKLPFFMTNWKHGELDHGIEEQARQFRYRFFAEIMRTTGAHWLLTAHQQNDQAETVLMKLIRTGNLAAVSGMRQVRCFPPGRLLRPLLTVSRTEIETYAERRALTWSKDESNATNAFLRNRIRHQVLPALVKENQQAVAHLAAFATNLQQQNDREVVSLDQTLSPLKITNGSQSIGLPLPLVTTNVAGAVRWLLGQLTSKVQISDRQCQEIAKLLANQAKPQGQIDLGSGYVLQKTYQQLTISWQGNNYGECPQKVPTFVVRLNHWYPLAAGRWFKVSKEPGSNPPHGGTRFALRADQLPLRVRRSRPTDQLRLANGGHKKLRRVFIDHKLATENRQLSQTLVTSDGVVLAVLGVQSSVLIPQTMADHYLLRLK